MFSDCLEFAAWTDKGQWNSILHKLRDNVSTNHIQGFYWLLVIHSDSCHSSSFCFLYLFFSLDSFACILQALANRRNIQPKKYLHFDIVTNQQEFDRIWGTVHLRYFAGSIIFLATKCQWEYGLLFKDPRGTTDFKWRRRSKDLLGLKF